jgi:hypothetical protein
MIAGAGENVHRGGSSSPKEVGEVASNLWIFSEEKDVGLSGTARGRTERVNAWRRRGCPAFGDEGGEGAGGRGDTQAVSIESAPHLSISDFVTSHKTCAVVLGAHACKSVQSNCN